MMDDCNDRKESPYKFLEVPVSEKEAWYPVYQDGKYLHADIVVPLNGKRFLHKRSPAYVRLSRTARKRMYKDFNRFLECAHMGINNPHFNTDVLHG